jgi:hypothetical protein
MRVNAVREVALPQLFPKGLVPHLRLADGFLTFLYLPFTMYTVSDATLHLIEGAVLGAVFSSLISVAITIWVERLRQPKLKLSIEHTPCDQRYGAKAPATESRHLRLEVLNEMPSGLAWWIARLPALQCRGEITFHHLDGQKVMDRTMTGRWRESPEPIPTPVVGPAGVQFQIIDFAKMNADPRVDIQASESALLDVAARFDQETSCWGWNNEAYFNNNNWRTPRWELPPGRYLVRAVIISAGQKHEHIVRMANDRTRTDFRLEPATKEDMSKVLGVN